MTAWDQLILHSTLPSGSAWDHLNAQQAGGTGVVVNDGIAVELTDLSVLVAIDAAPIEVEVDTGDVEVVVEDSPIQVVIEDAPISVEVQE